MPSPLLRRKDLERLGKKQLIDYVLVLEERLSHFQSIPHTFFFGVKWVLYKLLGAWVTWTIQRRLRQQEARLRQSDPLPNARILILATRPKRQFPDANWPQLQKLWGWDAQQAVAIEIIQPALPPPHERTWRNLFGLGPRLYYVFKKLTLASFLIERIGQYEFVVLETFLSYKSDLFLEELLLGYFQKTTLAVASVQQEIEALMQTGQYVMEPAELQAKLEFMQTHAARCWVPSNLAG